MNNDQLTLRLVADRARTEFGHRTVVSRAKDEVVTLTYAELFARVDRLAWALRTLGVRPGDRVATMAWNDHRHLELYFAVTLSGAVLHTVNVRLSPEQAVDVCVHAGDRVAFVDVGLSDLYDAIDRELPDIALIPIGSDGRAAVPDYEALLADQPNIPFDYPELTEDMPAATSYSSATTGTPKGVVYSHRAMTLHAMMLAMADSWAISESDRVLPVVPMFHVNAWGLPFAAIWMGAPLVLPGERPSAHDILDLLATYQVTMTAAVPTVWTDVFALMKSGTVRLPHLRLVVSGGGPLPSVLLRTADELSVPLVHSYGMTEASPLVLVGRRRSDAPTVNAGADLRLKQGYAVPGITYQVVGDDGLPVARDGVAHGELLLRGPWVAEEYERDERSARAFVDGWFHSGDIVTIDRDGYLQVVDRVSDMIKSGGEWISSIELGDHLTDHPAVAAAAVVGVPDDRFQERPCAYIVRSAPVESGELRSFLVERFPRFWIPDEFVFVDEIPLTSVGKHDKAALRRAHLAQQVTPATGG